MAYRLTQRAEEDIVEIYARSARDFGVPHAEGYAAGLIHTFEVLADVPSMARLRTEFQPPVRIHPFRAHVVIYQDVEADILIIRIRHGRENWSRDPPDPNA